MVMVKIRSDFGYPYLKIEGAIAHPEDVYIHCGCDECEWKWQKQLKAYNEANKPPDWRDTWNSRVPMPPPELAKAWDTPPDPDDDDGGLEEVPDCWRN